MRILACKWKAKELTTHEGRGTTRPTTSRIRESMMSMCAHQCNLSFSTCSVLDAFAGSGALGFELLSRGAAHLTAVEKNRTSFACLLANARNLHATSQEAQLICGDIFAPALYTRFAQPANLIVLDPPYAMSAAEISTLVAQFAECGVCAPSALIMYEHSRNEPLVCADNAPYSLDLLSEKSHGQTYMSLYRYTSHAHQ